VHLEVRAANGQILPDGVAFSGEGKLVRKATGYEQEKDGVALCHIGFAGCVSRASGAHWSLSVISHIGFKISLRTHQLLPRGR